MSEAAPASSAGMLRLEVKALTAKKACYCIVQRNAAFSKGTPIGTTALSNCLGIVIYNRLGKCGVVAHVEAQAREEYAQVVDKVLEKLMHAMNTGGGNQGSLSVVLMGNADGTGEAYCASVEASLYKHVGAGARLNKFGILDLRNNTARGDIGKATTDLGGNYRSCILDPANEVLWVDSMSTNIAPLPSRPGDVAHLVIQ
jgi:chemotaxis receptor (MCP) glutamine deamidase CheD